MGEVMRRGAVEGKGGKSHVRVAPGRRPWRDSGAMVVLRARWASW